MFIVIHELASRPDFTTLALRAPDGQEPLQASSIAAMTTLGDGQHHGDGKYFFFASCAGSLPSELTEPRQSSPRRGGEGDGCSVGPGDGVVRRRRSQRPRQVTGQIVDTPGTLSTWRRDTSGCDPPQRCEIFIHSERVSCC